jgi:prevent-host-death family protein
MYKTFASMHCARRLSQKLASRLLFVTAFDCTININAFIKGFAMALRTSDVVPISEARARLTELAEEVAGGGAEKVLTKNGSSFVAIVDARKLDYYHALEEEHAGLVLLDEAETGLRQLLAGQRVTSKELALALSDQ